MRDNAANMCAAFSKENGYDSAGCLSHSLQLVIKAQILNHTAVANALEKTRKICGYANKSTTFCAELFKQQKLQNPLEKEKVLIQDVVTRWNSTHDMGARFLELKPAIISSIANMEADVVELTKMDWMYLAKAIQALQVFKEATVMLSHRKASISMAIPIVTIIIRKLRATKDDHGVKQFKTDLKTGMEQRFHEMEEDEKYALATYLDPRYKGYFFRNPDSALRAKEKIAEKLEALLIEDQSVHSEIEDSSMELEQPNQSSIEIHSKAKRPKTIFATTMSEIMKENIYEQQNSPKMEAYNFLEHYANTSPLVMEENEDVDEGQKVLDFWKTMSESTKPVEKKAAKLAEHYLTPPPTSVDVERLFSTAGDIISNERNRLRPENAAKLLFLRENLPNVNYKY